MSKDTRDKARVYFQSLSGLPSYKPGEGIHVMIEIDSSMFGKQHFILKKGRVFTGPKGAVRYATAYARHRKDVIIKIDSQGLHHR